MRNKVRGTTTQEQFVKMADSGRGSGLQDRQGFPSALRRLAWLGLTGFLLNGNWEWLQTPLYQDATKSVNDIVWFRLHCTVGDVLILLACAVAVTGLRRSTSWLCRPRRLGFSLPTGARRAASPRRPRVYVFQRAREPQSRYLGILGAHAPRPRHAGRAGTARAVARLANGGGVVRGAPQQGAARVACAPVRSGAVGPSAGITGLCRRVQFVGALRALRQATPPPLWASLPANRSHRRNVGEK